MDEVYPFETIVALVGFFAREASKAIVFFFGLTGLLVIEGCAYRVLVESILKEDELTYRDRRYDAFRTTF